MLKVELHAHTADDPVDRIPYSTKELIDHAAALGFDAVAVTLHEKQLDLGEFRPYASERGVILIPGVERSIEGRHVLLLNFTRGADKIHTFEELRRLKRQSPGLVVAPHPFYPGSTCLRNWLDRHPDLFDAVEVNAMFTSAIDFNRRAERWALQHGKPIVGNGDVHRLRQMGTTYTLVDAEPRPDAICEAVAAGRVVVERRPLSLREAAGIMTTLVSSNHLPIRPSRDVSEHADDPRTNPERFAIGRRAPLLAKR